MFLQFDGIAASLLLVLLWTLLATTMNSLEMFVHDMPVTDARHAIIPAHHQCRYSVTHRSFPVSAHTAKHADDVPAH